MKRYMMLACDLLSDEILMLARELKTDFPIMFIPSELHKSPDAFRAYLQDVIDRLVNVDVLLLPAGRCGNGTVGLRSDTMSIVLPRATDCIDLLLSGSEDETPRSCYNFYLTKGWLEEENDNTFLGEYRYSLQKYGAETADYVMRTIYNGYRGFVFINTGAYDIQAAREKVRPLADLLSIEPTVCSGSCRLLKKMMRLELDEEFIVLGSGEPVTEALFEASSDAHPCEAASLQEDDCRAQKASERTGRAPSSSYGATSMQ